MDRETIIKMAREAGATEVDEVDPQCWIDSIAFESYELEAFAELVRDDYSFTHAQLWIKRINDAVAAEREACAKVCDDKVDAEYATGKVDHNEMGWTQACAIAIRARGQQ
jgi:hypothetical protein